MLAQNSYTYILIGLLIRFLMNTESNDTKKSVETTLENLAHNLEKGDFQVSLMTMQSVIFQDMVSQIEKLEDKTSPLGKPLALLICEQFGIVEQVIFAEASIKQIYVLPNRRFNSDFLLKSPQKLLKDGIFSKLDTIAKQDITSACRCILFGEATAAAFHILRATESVLKSYYFLHKKQKRLKMPMWGSMLKELNAKTKNKPPKTLLDSLDLIRSAYRNPTQHPEAIYEIDSAQDLFGVCIDAIGKMGSEL